MSLQANTEEVKNLLNERNVDILCISETWLLPHTPDTFVDVPNYTILYRRDSGRGGGVCIYAKQSLNFVVTDTNTPQQSGVKDLWLTVQRRKLPYIIICCMYRHPKAPSLSFDYIDNILHIMSIRRIPIFVLGDLNDDQEHVISHLEKQTSFTTYELTNANHPSSATLVDVIISNKSDIVHSSDVTPSLIADHYLISTTINISKTKSTPTLNTFRDLSHYDKDTFCLQLLSITDDLNKILNTDNVDVQVSTLTSVITKSLDTCAPMTAKMIRRPPAPWLTTEIREIIRARNEAQAILKADRLNVTLQNKYRDLNKHVKTLPYEGYQSSS